METEKEKKNSTRQRRKAQEDVQDQEALKSGQVCMSIYRCVFECVKVPSKFVSSLVLVHIIVYSVVSICIYLTLSVSVYLGAVH